MTTREEVRRKAEEIVRKVAEATQLGGGFRIYFASAVEQIVEIANAELRDVSARLRVAVDSTSFGHEGADAMLETLIADINERIRP